MQHAEGCAELRANIMQDPNNWLPDDFNPAWLAAIRDLPGPPQQAGQARQAPLAVILGPGPIQPNVQGFADPAQQPGPNANGLLGMLHMMRNFVQNPGQANANATPNPHLREGQHGR